MVVFEDGRPRKAHYRKFAIRTVAGQDDFAMMREVVGRRLRRLAAAARRPARARRGGRRRGERGGAADGAIGDAGAGDDEALRREFRRAARA